MGCPLVSKSVALDDLEQPNGRYLAFFPEFGSVGADYVKVIEGRPIQSATKCSPKNLVLALYHLWRYSQSRLPW